MQSLASQVSDLVRLSEFVLGDVAVAGWNGPDDAVGAAIAERATSVDIRMPEFLSVAVYDPAGHLAVGGRAVPADVSERDFFRDAEAVQGSQLRFGRSVRVGERLVVPIARRIESRWGAFLGVAAVAVGHEHVQRLFRGMEAGPDASISLLREDGAALVQVPRAAAGAPDAPDELLRSGTEITQVEVRPAAGGAMRLVTMARVPDSPLLLSIGRDSDAILAPWRDGAFASLAVLGVMLAGVATYGVRQMRDLRGLLEAERRASRALAGMRESEARYRLLAKNATDMIVRMDLDGRWTYVSPACVALLGRTPAELTGGSIFATAHPGDAAGLRAAFDGVSRGLGDHRTFGRAVRADGRTIWMEANLRLVRDPDTGAPREVVGVVRDVTERKLDEDRIRHLAGTDHLTGLPNRRFFIEALDAALREEPGCAVLFIDLDAFKPVNDLHGHPVGDLVLVEAAARLHGAAPAGAVVGRIGGDEFAVLLRPGGGTGETATPDAVARRLLDALAAPTRVGDVTVEIGASIGISASPADGDTAEALLRTADIAMYRAKRAGGRGWCFFRGEMEAELRDASGFKDRLRVAIAAGRLVPYYQPLVRLADGMLVGFEALARWEDPARGTIPPDSFIPQAEEGGMIGELFDAVFRQACRDARSWPAGTKLSMNISPVQLQDTALPRVVLDILGESGLAPDRLEVEVTETGIVKDLETAKRSLRTLREHGIRVALDDFGTGYASLQMLRDLRFDRLKVDRSFARSVASDPASGRYVAAILDLARALGLETTTEGIEDAETARRIAAMGCSVGQGYFFGRPRPAAALDGFLRRFAPRQGATLPRRPGPAEASSLLELGPV